MSHKRQAMLLPHAVAAALILSNPSLPPAWGQAGDGAGNNYYPAANSPIANDEALQKIEEKLAASFRKTKSTAAGSFGGFLYTVPTLILPIQGVAPYNPVPAPANPPGLPSGASVVGYSVVNEAELNAALGAVVADKLNEAAGAYSGSLKDLIFHVASYRKGKVGKYISAATESVIAAYAEESDEVQRVAALEDVAIGAVSAEPTQAAAVVTSMLKVVAPTLKLSKTVTSVSVPHAMAADDIVEKAVEQAAASSEAIVKAAINTVKTVIDSNDPDIARKLIQNVAAEALNTAFSSEVGASHLGQKIAVQIGLAAKTATRKNADKTVSLILTSADVVNAIFTIDPSNPDDSYTISDLTNRPDDIKNVALVAAGLMKGFADGRESDSSTNIIEAIKAVGTLGLTADHETYLDKVEAGFLRAKNVALPRDAATVAAAVASGAGANANHLAAYVTGAGAWLEKAIPLFIDSVLAADAQFGGADTVKDIVEAAVRSSQASVAKIARAAAAWGKRTDAQIGGTPESARLGQILEGSALGLKANPLYNTLLPATAAAILKASPLSFVKDGKANVLSGASAALLGELAFHGASGVTQAERPSAISFFVKGLAAAAAKDENGYKTILENVIGNAPNPGYVANGEQWRAVLGAMAAYKLRPNKLDPYPESPIPDYAATLANYDAGLNAAAIEAGGTLIEQLQVFPKRSFASMYDAFAESTAVGVERVALAVMTGAALVAPANAAVAAALAVKLTNASEAAIRSEAALLNAAASKNIALTITAATRAKASSLTLFDDVEQLIFLNPKNAIDIVTGATIVAPNYAHIVAHAAGFRAPAAAPKVVPALFNYSHLTSTDPAIDAPLANRYANSVDATAAITAAITTGILEAKTNTVKKPLAETNLIKSTVAALVKQALTLSGNTPTSTAYLPNIHNGGTLIAGEGPGNFKVSNGRTPDPTNSDPDAGGYVLGKQVGPAGVITGVISQILDPANILTSGPGAGKLPANSAVTSVIQAAVNVVKKNKSHVLAVAQAAAQSIKWMAPQFGVDGEAQIVSAVVAGLGKSTVASQSEIFNAVRFGVLAAAASIPAAGAAGVINFTHRTASGAPVTDIFEL